jgi:hypothetical protein
VAPSLSRSVSFPDTVYRGMRKGIHAVAALSCPSLKRQADGGSGTL